MTSVPEVREARSALDLTEPIPALPAPAPRQPEPGPTAVPRPADRPAPAARRRAVVAERVCGGAALICAGACAVATMTDASRVDRLVLLVAAAFLTAGAWIATKNRHTGELDEARRSARTDDLTGLANRRALIDDLDDALSAGRAPALLILDLDGFKAVNDAHGHLAGDQVLIALARRLQADAGPDDLPARLGGDEFAVLVPTDHPTTLRDRAHRLRADLMRPVPTYAGAVSVQASVGVAVRASSDNTSIDLLHRADLAMYQAKSGTVNVIVDHGQ
jgi:diguanylate cyclase